MNLRFSKKGILIIIGIIIIVLSIGLNLYWIAWKSIERSIYQKATDGVINTILFQVQNTGEVIINTDDGQIILVPKY